MITNDNDIKQITETVNLYFLGTYHADVEQIKLAFHPDAMITGSFNGNIIHWTLADFMERVTATSAAKNNDKYDKQIILIDIVNAAAIVKARVVINEIMFIDYITLLKIDGTWKIRNKSFTT